MITRHYLVEGKVQGVGFRRFIFKRVAPLGVRGWVRNLEDGRVEALLQGDREDVMRAEVYLRRGPDSGEVKSVQARDVKADLHGEFQIKEDGVKGWEF